jgi:hypothetical protein
MKLIVFGVYTFLASYNAGNMMSLQIQHYGIYPLVGKENFKNYMSANNKAALLPAIVPGILMHVLCIVLVFYHPAFVTTSEAITSLVLNIIGFISTIKWQRPLQADMAKDGYNDAKLRLLLSTNWIRTAAFMLLSILTIWILIRAIE